MINKTTKTDNEYVIGRRPPTDLNARAERQLKYSNVSRQSSFFATASAKLFSTSPSSKNRVVVSIDEPLKRKKTDNPSIAKGNRRTSHKTSTNGLLIDNAEAK